MIYNAYKNYLHTSLLSNEISNYFLSGSTSHFHSPMKILINDTEFNDIFS